MNPWTTRSIDLARTKDYLDQLYAVYPLEPEPNREIDPGQWDAVKEALRTGSDADVVEALLRLPIFPIKDSYVAFLRKHPSAIKLNPTTVGRLAKRIRSMGLDELWKRCSEPKETNRQVGPLFRQWVRASLRLPVVPLELFEGGSEDAVLDAPDAQSKSFARKCLGYQAEKGLDIVARVKGVYVIGEAKFITDTGGHQDRQFDDAVSLLRLEGCNAIVIAVLDGVLYLSDRNRYARHFRDNPGHNILSALLLSDFLGEL